MKNIYRDLKPCVSIWYVTLSNLKSYLSRAFAISKSFKEKALASKYRVWIGILAVFTSWEHNRV